MQSLVLMGGFRPAGSAQLGGAYRNRPERGVVTGAESAGGAADWLRAKLGVSLNLEPACEFSFLRIKLELDDRHGGYGAHELRVHNAQQRLGNLRKLIIDLEVDAGSEKSEALEQPLDMRILAFVLLQSEARCDLRMFLWRTRRRIRADSLARVRSREAVHRASSPPTMRQSPPLRSMTVSKLIGSGTGSMRSIASMRRRTPADAAR